MMRKKSFIHISGFRTGSFVSGGMQRIFLSLAVFCMILAGATLLGQGGQSVDRSSSANDDIMVWNGNLAGKTVVIDPGHGGIDPGAIGVTGVKEKDVNLAVALKVKEFLLQSGVDIVMIREDDRDYGTSTGASKNKSEDLAYRTKVVEESDADITLSIHGNSFSDRKQQGAQVFHYKGSKDGAVLAKELQERLNKVTGHPRIIRSDTFYMLRNTRGIALTVEIGFLSNPEEEKRLVDTEYQSKIALAIALGVANYLEK